MLNELTREQVKYLVSHAVSEAINLARHVYTRDEYFKEIYKTHDVYKEMIYLTFDKSQKVTVAEAILSLTVRGYTTDGIVHWIMVNGQ